MVRFTSRCAALLAVGTMALTACGSETTVTTNTNSNGRVEDNSNSPPENLTETSDLLHIAPCDATTASCARTMSVGDTLELGVKLLDSEGNPVRNAFIEWELEITSGAEGATLDAVRSATDTEGVARVNLRTRDDNPAANMGSLSITASVRDAENIAPRSFTIGISTKEGGAYIINYNHVGEATPSRVNTLILSDTVSCEEATDEFFESGFWPPALVTLPAATVYPNGDISQVVYPQVSNGESLTIIGIGRQTIGSRDIDVAYGCSDDNPAVEMGQDVVVDIDLTDHLPNIRGVYDVTHRFNLAGALPPPVQTAIQLIDTLANNPAVFILGCPSTTNNNNADDYCDSDSLGLLDLLIQTGLLGTYEDTVNSFRDGPLYGVAIAFLNELLYGDPNDPTDTGILPDWASTGITAAGDITDMLQEFTVNGRMRFDGEPDLVVNNDSVIGYLAAEDNIQYWDTIVFTWSQGCQGQGPSCSQVPVSANQVGPGTSNVIEGNFGAQLRGASSLVIEEHSLTVHYGELILAAIENVVLPRLFGPEVQSLDALLDGDNDGPGILDCSSMAQYVADTVGNSFYGTAYDVCVLLRNEAVTAVRDTIAENLVASGNDYFKLQTPNDTPCTVYQPENYQSGDWPGFPRPYIEMLGKSDPTMRCDWSADVRFSAEGDPINLEGTFHGELDRLLD